MPRYLVKDDQWVPDYTMERAAPPWSNDHQWFSGLGARADRETPRPARVALRGLGTENTANGMGGLSTKGALLLTALVGAVLWMRSVQKA